MGLLKGRRPPILEHMFLFEKRRTLAAALRRRCKRLRAMLREGGAVVILGIDPGLANTGWGVVETRGSEMRARAYGCIHTPSGSELAVRLRRIADELSQVVERYRPQEAAVEGVYFGANTRSAIPTAHARGAALVACSLCGVEIGEYTPMQIKQAVVGTGAADKRQVAYMVRTLLCLDHDPRPDHAADALACAICHAHLRETSLITRGAYVQEKGDPYA